MNNNGKLYIIITDNPNIQSTQTTITKTTTTTTNTTKVQSAGSGNGSGDDALFGFAVHQFYHFIQQEATEAANWSISNIGNFTGDYVKQANVQKAVGLAGKVAGIGMSIAAGAQVGGVWGALIAGTIAVASTAISIGLEDKANAFQVYKQNREIAQLRELSGLNPLTNGGRI